MAKKEETRLSIVIRAVDQATAKIRAINQRLDAATKPVRDFRKELSDLKEKSGLNGLISGVKGVGSAFRDLLGKLTLVGAAAGGVVFAIKSMIDEFDDLGDQAERVGLSVDALAQLRFAAQKSGLETQKLDRGMLNFSKTLGEARAGTGSLKSFLDKVSPALLKQLKAAKGNEEAFNLMAAAMVKLEDPAKRAALAQQAFGDASLATLLGRGPKAIDELRQRYLELAGPQGDATRAAGDFGDSMDDLKASTDGIKAALVTGLAPALKVIVERLREWFTAHRAEIAEWAKNIGEKLPGALKAAVEWVQKAFDKVSAFVESVGGLKTVAIAAAAVIAGPLISSIVTLSGALLTALSRAGLLGKALGGLGGAGAGGAARVAATGALGAVALPVAAGLAIHQVGSALGVNHEGLASKIARMQEEARGGGDRRGVIGAVLEGMERQRAAQARSVVDAARLGTGEKSSAKITVDFAHAPPGTRVRTDRQSTADVDLSVGYQLGGAL